MKQSVRRNFNYGVEDDNFIVKYIEGNSYSIKCKLTNTEYVVDNVDCDTTPNDLLDMIYEQVEDVVE